MGEGLALKEQLSVEVMLKHCFVTAVRDAFLFGNQILSQQLQGKVHHTTWVIPGSNSYAFLGLILRTYQFSGPPERPSVGVLGVDVYLF